MELLQCLGLKGQASFEFIVVLSIVLTLAMVFIVSITTEYTDSFVISAVKNAAQSETFAVAMSSPACTNTTLAYMSFDKSINTIVVNTTGCPVSLAKIAGIVETKICGAKVPQGSASMLCSGTIYTLISE